MSLPEPRKPLLPDHLRNPQMLWWVWALPQLVLGWLNVRAYTLVTGELSSSERTQFLLVLGAQIALAVVGLVGPFVLRRMKWQLHFRVSAVILVLHIAYIWMSTVLITGGDMIPQSVQLWILPPGRMLFLQLMFIMPATYYAGVLLACHELTISERQDGVMSLIALVAIPAGAFAVVTLASNVFDVFFNNDFAEVLFVLMAICGTVLVMAALVRLLFILTRWVLAKGHGRMVLALLIGVAAPIGGLVLNHSIPFPFDFQSPGVYVLAGVNGLLLMIPVTGRKGLDRMVWLLQTISFSYTLYFFLVFLPYTPLSLLAMIAFGAGFLILAPTALFVFHTGLLCEGFSKAKADWGLPKTVACFVAALLVVPLGYSARALQHKEVLFHAMEYVYDANPAKQQRFNASLPMLQTTLQKMIDHKQGFELPFLTAYYNWLVFDGLVLPNKKMKHLYQTFFGEELEVSKQPGQFGDMFSGRQRDSWFGPRFTVPGTKVNLKQVSWSQTTEDRCRALIAKVEMVGAGAREQEFVTSIHLPPGALISGFWLHVGKERVPGRIFERKTAEWVYHMIRDTSPRDPGLLVYKSPTELELRVYPINNNEERTVEIEFLFPDGFTPEITVGGISPPKMSSTLADVPRIVQVPGKGSGVVLSGSAQLPSVGRKPMLHFIIDRGAQTQASLDDQLALARELRSRFERHAGAQVMLANFESDRGPGVFAPGEPIPGAEAWSLPPRGGFSMSRMLRSVLLQVEADLRGPRAAEHALTYPVIFVLSDQALPEISDIELQYLAQLSPEHPVFTVAKSGHDLTRHRLGGKRIVGPVTTATESVHLFEAGGTYRAAVTGRPAAVWIPHEQEAAELRCWNSRAGALEPMKTFEAIPEDSRYARGEAAWLHYFQSLWTPEAAEGALREQVAQSRESRVLLPSTSYIVVENAAQWEILKRKENQKLGKHDELEFMETPEPPWWVLVFGYLGYRRFRARRTRIAGN